MAAKVKKNGHSHSRNLRAECERLRHQVARLTVERDNYLRSLYSLTRKAQVTFTPEELSAMAEVDLQDISRELDQELKDRSCPTSRPSVQGLLVREKP